MNTRTALDQVRSQLLALHPSGADGFEGLAANAVAGLTGLTLRLAKSGSQFGRDASSTPSSDFAVALEGKLYSGDLRLEDLAGKTVLAAAALAGRVDVWMVAATGEIGDDTLLKLADILEDKGITLLALDWAERPLPPLAVLLAAVEDRVATWFEPRIASSDLTALRSALTTIRKDSSFAAQADTLKRHLQAGQVGLDSLRHRNADWAHARLADARLSKQSFGQRITVSASPAPAMPRGRLLSLINPLIRPDPDDLSITAVLGGEGAGKTWLVAQWWAAKTDPPILVLVSGRAAAALDPDREALETLATLIAEQDGRRDAGSVGGWLRRLRRWKGEGTASSLRFVVVLDGLNEHPRQSWSTLIRALAPEIQALGGRLVVTSREAFWQREIRPRLGSGIAVEDVRVTDYDDAELSAALASRGRVLSSLPRPVAAFVRNPRVCAVALDLLDRLAISEAELTIDRLLLEYWRSRLEERGDAVAHNDEDFSKLLREHARAWLARPRRTFDRDAWADYSGVAKRRGLDAALQDLDEIADGEVSGSGGGSPGLLRLPH